MSAYQARVSKTKTVENLWERDPPHMCRAGGHKTLCWILVILIKAGLSTVWMVFRKTPPRHVAEPRDCPCPPRAPGRVGVRVGDTDRVVGLGLGLMLGLGSGWSEATCKVETCETCPAQIVLPTSPASSGSSTKRATS